MVLEAAIEGILAGVDDAALPWRLEGCLSGPPVVEVKLAPEPPEGSPSPQWLIVYITVIDEIGDGMCEILTVDWKQWDTSALWRSWAKYAATCSMKALAARIKEKHGKS